MQTRTDVMECYGTVVQRTLIHLVTN